MVLSCSGMKLQGFVVLVTAGRCW